MYCFAKQINANAENKTRDLTITNSEGDIMNWKYVANSLYIIGAHTIVLTNVQITDFL